MDPLTVLEQLITESVTGLVDDREAWIEMSRVALKALGGSDAAAEIRRFDARVIPDVPKARYTINNGTFEVAVKESVLSGRAILVGVVASYKMNSRGVTAASEPEPAEGSMSLNSDSAGGKTSVFLVHGRDKANTEAMTLFLESLGLRVIPWEEAIQATGNPNEAVGKIVDKGIEMADAVVVLFSPDERVELRSDLLSPTDSAEESRVRWQPRPNVIYEAGLSMANQDKKTVLVSVGDVSMFSDLSGLHILRIDNTAETRGDLVERLETAGLLPKRSGNRWMRTGTFVLERMSEVRSPLQVPADADTSEESIAEESAGTVELMAEMEDALPLLLESIEAIGDGANAMNALMGEATEAGNGAQSAKQRLAILQQFATNMRPLVDAEEVRAEEFTHYIGWVDGGVNVMLDQAEAGEFEPDQKDEIVSLLITIVHTANQTASMSASIGTALGALPAISKLARPVKTEMKRLGVAYRMHRASLETIDQWSVRSQRILATL